MFPTTNWSMLAVATASGDTAGRGALAQFCENYRAPVVAFLRNRGLTQEEAEDTAQDFFLELIESRAWKRANAAKGRFRTFLLGTLMHVAGRERTRQGALKRGGGQFLASLEELHESGFEPPSPSEPDARLFDREWAFRLMELALARIAHSLMEEGRAADWQVLVRFLPGAGESPSYEEAAAQLGISAAALKTAVHRVRQRFREELRGAVACTVSAVHEVDDELAYLHQVLSSPAS